VAEIDPEPVETADDGDVVESLMADIPANRPRKVYAGMWGPLEIAAVSLGALVVLTASLIYFFFVIPANRELARNKSEADRLDAELISARSKYGEITDTETQVAKLVSSIDDFETRFLPVPSTGQTALYQRLNGLIAAYGLVNTTGPDYAPLETADQNPGQQTDEEKGRAKFRSLYPGVYVSTTVEGSYQNLRRFIREIETGREFIIVSAVELAPSETEKQPGQPNPAQNTAAGSPVNTDLQGPSAKGFPPGLNPGVPQNQTLQRPRPQGKMHGETVSLHIEMAAYFRRANFAPRAAEQ
jgi:hypothetical protein